MSTAIQYNANEAYETSPWRARSTPCDQALWRHSIFLDADRGTTTSMQQVLAHSVARGITPQKPSDFPLPGQLGFRHLPVQHLVRLALMKAHLLWLVHRVPIFPMHQWLSVRIGGNRTESIPTHTHTHQWNALTYRAGVLPLHRTTHPVLYATAQWHERSVTCFCNSWTQLVNAHSLPPSNRKETVAEPGAVVCPPARKIVCMRNERFCTVPEWSVRSIRRCSIRCSERRDGPRHSHAAGSFACWRAFRTPAQVKSIMCLHDSPEESAPKHCVGRRCPWRALPVYPYSSRYEERGPPMHFVKQLECCTRAPRD